jgi:hypothetical protein
MKGETGSENFKNEDLAKRKENQDLLYTKKGED